MHSTMFKLHVAYIVELLWCEIRHGNKWQVYVLATNGNSLEKVTETHGKGKLQKKFGLV